MLPSASRPDTTLVFRLQRSTARAGSGEGAGAGDEAIAEYPVHSTWHEGFFTFEAPVDTPIVAAIGTRYENTDFEPLVMSLPVRLPEAPEPTEAPAARTDAPPAAPVKDASRPDTAAESSQPSAPVAATSETRAQPRHRPALDEAAILRIAGSIEGLPEELRRLPAATAPAEASPPQPQGTIKAPPVTPHLNERRIVKSALRAIIEAAGLPSPEGEVSLEPTPADSPPPPPTGAEAGRSGASSRLASQVDDLGANAAPIHLEATLVITGLLPEGYRLRLGGAEVPVLPGGRFYRQHRIQSFPAAWTLLLQAVADTGFKEAAPSVELLAEMPDQKAALSMSAFVEIEGEVRDPACRPLLPPQVSTDAAGRFRIVRPVPAGALFLPHLVLLAQ